MSIRFLRIRALVPAACLSVGMLVSVSPLFSQQPAAPAAPTAPAPAAAAPAAKVPDYPDARTAWIGVEGLSPMTFSGPDIVGGKPAVLTNTYETLYNIGKPYKIMPMLEGGIPVTRTGTVNFDFERYHGWADQTLTRFTAIDTFGYLAGDAIHSIYHVTTGRIYLDDLLYPHKFPVSKLRFRSIWGIRYISVNQSVISSSEDAKSTVGGASFNQSSVYIFYPEFGLGMEYAVAPHVLFRVDGAGFGIPHRSNLAETSATLSVRHGHLEVEGGIKTLHFQTTPQKPEYVRATFVSPFVGLRWHF